MRPDEAIRFATVLLEKAQRILVQGRPGKPNLKGHFPCHSSREQITEQDLVTTVPLPKPTRDLHCAAGLSREAMHHREARSNTSADTFGGEERLLGPPQRFLTHSVGDADLHIIVAREPVGRAANALRRQAAALWHGVARVSQRPGTVASASAGGPGFTQLQQVCKSVPGA